MRFIYSVLIKLAWVVIWFTQFFSDKMKLFVSGRKNTFSVLSNALSPSDKTLWFHCASLGEYEQGVPVMEELKKQFPKHKLVISFFSPSGFEVKKNTSIADVVVYLPWDTYSNAKQFIHLINPSLAVFVKYEVWANYLYHLQKKEIPVFLISALFRDNQIYFKTYGGFLRKALQKFTHVFVQNQSSKMLAQHIGIKNVSISGDTRYDRVFLQTKQDNELPFIEAFIDGKLCLVCGSTWKEDEAVLIDYIHASDEVKIILAPHQISASTITELQNKIAKKTVLFSEKESKDLARYSVFIIDTVGLLTKIYNYADMAYVGGAMGNTGLHNILEPAVFGVPIVIGHNYKDFPEADLLQKKGGLFAVSSSKECSSVLQKLETNTELRTSAGKTARDFIIQNTGATKIITKKIKEYLGG